jgi:hypothetical protein
VIANSGNLTHTTTFSLTVGTSFVRITPGNLVFAPQQINTTSPPQSLTLTNAGSSPLSITSIIAAGTGNSDFAQTNNCPASLAASKACTITVTFTPKPQQTNIAGTVTFPDSDLANPQIANLTGTGVLKGNGLAPVVTLSPISLTFGSQNIGTSSAQQTITLINTGDATLTLNTVTITGNDPSDFIPANKCSGLIPAGTSCSIFVT